MASHPEARLVDPEQVRALTDALASGAVRLAYQPLIDVATGQMSGVEALLRWRDPVRGEVPAGELVDLAERAGLSVALDDWVLHTALQQLAAWDSVRDGDCGLRMSVNISGSHLAGRDLSDTVAALLRAWGLPGARLEIEITERAPLAAAAVEEVARLRALGVRIALDDFGTGFSSLEWLLRLDIDTLKIDRMFIERLPHDPRDVKMVDAVMAMARGLGLDVVAEGVETEAQRDFLARAGCGRIQGWYYAKALPAADVLPYGARRSASVPHAAVAA